jgi:hypothetical protein
MSALPPKADMCGATTDVRFGPIADMHSIDDFIRPLEQRSRHSEPERIRSLEIDQ